jgi:hypothetical protein
MLAHHYTCVVTSLINLLHVCSVIVLLPRPGAEVGVEVEWCVERVNSEIILPAEETAQTLALEYSSGLCVAKVEIRGPRTDEGISPRPFARQQT